MRAYRWLDDDSTEPYESDAWMLEDVFREHGRQVALDELPDGRRLSTVFLVLDHSFGSGPPVLFESAVFAADGEVDEMYRYCTAAEARAGHADLLARLRPPQ